MNIFHSVKNNLIDFFDNHFTTRKEFEGDPNLLDEVNRVEGKDIPTQLSNNLIEYAALDEKKILIALDSSTEGLSAKQVAKRIDKYGKNEIKEQDSMSWQKHLWLCYKNPFNLLLTVLDAFYIITGDYQGTTVITIMVLVSTFLRYFQESKSNNAAKSLKEMVSTTVTVVRSDEEEDYNEDDEHLLLYERVIRIEHKIKDDVHAKTEVAISALVPGDIVLLSAGDLIPADVRIISAKDLFVSQAALTGESLPVEKFAKPRSTNIKNPLELENIGFMGTNIVSGTAISVVVATGANTLFGSLANKVMTQNHTETSFQMGINRISWLLIYFMLIMSPLVFVLNGVTKHDWFSATMFALSIAVGLTPEMLPMIVTSTLAKGAVFMSRRKVIVKRLDAIQNFGAMDILCTDKTGTLTQDKICLTRHTDIFGNNYDDVLEYAYLNSYYQTGLKNLLDVAVLENGTFGDIPKLVKRYTKVDEVPFDFQRRRMSVVVKDAINGSQLLICKGAVEEVLGACKYAYDKEKIFELDQESLTTLQNVTRELNQEGLRVVAVATKEYTTPLDTYSVKDEAQMVLIGYIAFMDPPKETTAPAIEALHRNGVTVKILTGDNELVTAKVCKEVGLDVNEIMLGYQIDELSDAELYLKAKKVTVFAKLTPSHKERIVKVLHDNGHVVGFMGDGINDAPALRTADIGISVDTAVDIAKEAADIILLEKSLMVLEQGIIEGRKTFSNMFKYIKMTASSNFGNVFSVLVASAFLPFEPMLPLQLLMLNLIYDISQVVIPFDNVDKELLNKPQKLDAGELKRFMLYFGPLSSIFDIATFVVLWYVFKANTPAHAGIFQTGWFVESLMTQMLIVHLIRSPKIPFIQSRASTPVFVMSMIMIGVGLSIALVPSSTHYFQMEALPTEFFIWVAGIVVCYLILVQSVKKYFVKKFAWQ